LNTANCRLRIFGNWEREWIYWYDCDCMRYPTAEERSQQAEAIATQQSLIAQQEHQQKLKERQQKLQERQQKLQERQQKEKLENYLRSMGINPDEI